MINAYALSCDLQSQYLYWKYMECSKTAFCDTAMAKTLTQSGSHHSNMGKLQLKVVDLQCPSMCHTDENIQKVPKNINKD
jgi:hypothetical protein